MTDLTAYREEITDRIIESAVNPNDHSALITAMTIEYGNLLTSAEVFDNFIPGSVSGVGTRNRKFKIDGYQIDDADGSLHLVITDFAEASDSQPLARGDAETLFKNCIYYLEVCRDGSIWNHERSVNDQLELSEYVEKYGDSVTRFRFHLFTNRLLSDRFKSLDIAELGDKAADFQVWDIARLESVTRSRLGAEEFVVDFSKYAHDGLPCIKANETDDYEGYLAVIDGQTLTQVYDEFGGRLLEGNVRAYLSARGKVNKGIQKTIRTEPEKFFAFNNGISCTATEADIEKTSSGLRLKSAKYLQIVNGGQTTASLFVAAKTAGLGYNSLPQISIQMKLSVVQPENSEALDELIGSISRYSNTQNTVKDSDFFSSHEFHRVFEGHAQNIPAPPDPGTTYETYWFYERARGAYEAAQMLLTPTQRRAWQRARPKNKKIEKTDLAKFIHAWMQMPHRVCETAQKNFKVFAEYVLKDWGELGAKFKSEEFYKESVAKAILYRRMEKIVDKASWYQPGSGYRQGLVSYSIALLSFLIEKNAHGSGLDFRKIWRDQSLSPVLETELDRIGATVSKIITAPAYDEISIAGLEWFKKEDCWKKVRETNGLELSEALKRELISADEIREIKRDQRKAGAMDAEIDIQTEIFNFGQHNWVRLREWCLSNNVGIYGSKEGILRNAATRQNWLPSVTQAKLLKEVLNEAVEHGFQKD
jgi:hypothetical protein